MGVAQLIRAMAFGQRVMGSNPLASTATWKLGKVFTDLRMPHHGCYVSSKVRCVITCILYMCVILCV